MYLKEKNLTMEEMWKPIKNYEGLYEVSNFGNVKRINKVTQNRILKPYGERYPTVSLSKNDKRALYRVHKLVANHFIEKPESHFQVNHKDGIRTNNHIDNLEWVSPSDNVLHAYKIGLIDASTKYSCGRPSEKTLAGLRRRGIEI